MRCLLTLANRADPDQVALVRAAWSGFTLFAYRNMIRYDPTLVDLTGDFFVLRGAFGKFLAGSFISVTDLQTLSCLISFWRTIFSLCYGTNSMRIIYEGCSNMNASSFITFFTYMLRQNGKRFYKGLLYVTFKLALDLNKNKVYFSSYSPLNEGHVSILTNSMLWAYTSARRAYNSLINRWNFLKFLRKYAHVLI